MTRHPKVYCAADTPDTARALEIARAMVTAQCGLKIGMEFFNAQGQQGLRAIVEQYPTLDIFLDLKFHDIPNTVAGAVRAVSLLRPSYINVHALGGPAMMKAARAAAQEGDHKPRLLAVTLLTSMDEDSCAAIGLPLPLKDRVVQLARAAQDAGLDGVVCSAHEIEAIRTACGPDFILMVPGIRPATHEMGSDDQKRVMTPVQALQTGATHLVIGRPITGADDPAAAAQSILHDIEKSA